MGINYLGRVDPSTWAVFLHRQFGPQTFRRPTYIADLYDVPLNISLGTRNRGSELKWLATVLLGDSIAFAVTFHCTERERERERDWILSACFAEQNTK
jgi:hypothetical protein